MKTNLSLPYRKRKTRIALYIRVVCLVSIPSFYLIASFFAPINDNIKNGNWKGASFSDIFQINCISVQSRSDIFNRKLLAINETTFIRNEAVSEVITEMPRINDEIAETTVTIQLKNCTRAAILDFPSDGLNRNQRRHGWIVLHILVACYCFWLLAIVCDDYFVPAIGVMCFSEWKQQGSLTFCLFYRTSICLIWRCSVSALNMQEDVVGATFMAVSI